MGKFDVYYDDEVWDVINTISGKLIDFGIELKDITTDGSEFLTYSIKNLKQDFIEVKIGSYYLDTNIKKCYNYSNAVDTINNYFKEQGFEIKNGIPYDKRFNEKNMSAYENDNGFTIFGEDSEWEIIEHNGHLKVIKFKHNGGSGPLGEFVKD